MSQDFPCHPHGHRAFLPRSRRKQIRSSDAKTPALLQFAAPEDPNKGDNRNPSLGCSLGASSSSDTQVVVKSLDSNLRKFREYPGSYNLCDPEKVA